MTIDVTMFYFANGPTIRKLFGANVNENELEVVLLVAITLQACIREVSGVNLGPVDDFQCFLSPAKCRRRVLK